MTPETYQDNKEEVASLVLNPSGIHHEVDSDSETYDADSDSQDESDNQEPIDEDSIGNSSFSGNSPEPKKLPADLVLRISESLHRKLVTKAKQEGVLVEDFASELLAEGLVLRAWEIMERKNHVRESQPRQGFNQGNNGHGNRGNGGNQGRGNGNHFRDNRGNGNGNGNSAGRGNSGGGFRRSGMSQNRYNTIMEDKAEFLEYVRAQERKNQR